MRRLLLRRGVTLAIGTITALVVLTVPAVGGETTVGQPTVALLQAGRHRVFDVRRLPQLGLGDQELGRDDITERHGPAYRTLPGGESAPVGAGLADGSLAPAPSAVSFEGMHFSESCGATSCGDGHPPDTNGDVGPTYYVQSINTSVAIYDKSNGNRVAAFSFDVLMSQGSFGNLCDTNNFGDPVVLYDTFHGHWVITDFAFVLQPDGSIASPPGSFQCFAVSQTSNPVTGGWNFYSMSVSDMLQDYPKFGIWPDGLYMSANMFGFGANDPFANVRVWALNLAAMEAGDANTEAVWFDVPKVQGTDQFSLLPSNARLQTGAPPAGRPNFFTALAFSGPFVYTNLVRVWTFHVDWSNPGNSSFSAPTDSSTGSTWNSPPATVPSKNGNDLDTLAFRLMMQNQYTNVGGVESLWNVHTVGGSSSSQAAVRWYQVPVTGGTIGNALQASTWNPDSANRFMPSLAVDRVGNMALGYSVSSSALFPAIRYAGRLATDPPSTLSLTESSIVEGTGSQTGNCGSSACERWGDYSAMTLDVDGCTFWYTNEYYVTSGLDHHTRIGSFAFPGCATSTVPTISALSVHAGPTAGGQTVIITGTNFSGVNWVSFGSTAAASFTVDSATQITAVTPAHAAGTIHVRVNTAAGTSSATNADLYVFQ